MLSVLTRLQKMKACTTWRSDCVYIFGSRRSWKYSNCSFRSAGGTKTNTFSICKCAFVHLLLFFGFLNFKQLRCEYPCVKVFAKPSSSLHVWIRGCSSKSRRARVENEFLHSCKAWWILTEHRYGGLNEHKFGSPYPRHHVRNGNQSGAKRGKSFALFSNQLAGECN